jgi:hypothetical protein
MWAVLLLICCKKIQSKLDRGSLNTPSLSFRTEIYRVASEGLNLFRLNNVVSNEWGRTGYVPHRQAGHPIHVVSHKVLGNNA